MNLLMIISIIFASGSLINVLLVGFSKLTIVYLVLSGILLIYSIPFTGKLLKMGVNKKRDMIINAVVFILVFSAAGIFGGIIFKPKDMSYSNSANKAAALLNKGDFKGAEKILTKLYQEEPNNLSVNQNLSVVYLKDKKTDLARKHLDEALRIDPSKEDVWFNYGLLFYQLKDYDNALRCFNEVVKLNPSFAKAWQYSGYMSFLKRDLRRAIYYYSEANLLNPSSPQILVNMAAAHRDLMEYNKAAEKLNEALKLNPSEDLKKIINEELTSLSYYIGGEGK